MIARLKARRAAAIAARAQADRDAQIESVLAEARNQHVSDAVNAAIEIAIRDFGTRHPDVLVEDVIKEIDLLTLAIATGTLVGPVEGGAA
jgi:hypothetical protein